MGIDWGEGDVSETGWEADDDFDSLYTYDYFDRKIDESGETINDDGLPIDFSLPSGGGIYRQGSDWLLIGGTVAANENLTILIDGNLTIEGGSSIISRE